MNRSFRFLSLTLGLLASAATLTPVLADEGGQGQRHAIRAMKWGHRRPAPPRPPRHPEVAVEPGAVREVASELKADIKRAEQDLRVQLEKAVGLWIAEDGVPADWAPPRKLVDRMIVGQVYIEPVKVKDLDVFRATVEADFSAARKRELRETYHRQEGGRRLAVVGGVLALVLALLAGISGYIRADEATKGYYTNRLRLLAAAGVGAAGVAVYQVLT